MNKKLFTYALVAILSIFLVSCDGVFTPNTPNSSSQNNSNDDNDDDSRDTTNAKIGIKLGTIGSVNTKFNVNKKPEDPPPVTGLDITFNEFYVHRLGAGELSGWNPIIIEETTIDVFDILGLETLIKSMPIPPGRYNQLRFGVTAATVYTEDGETHEASISSGKLKMNLHFEVDASGLAQVILELDLSKCLKTQGGSKNLKYKLQPAMKVKNVIVTTDPEEEE